MNMLASPSAVVVGAGMLGTFVARALVSAGADVTCVDTSPQPGYIRRHGPAGGVSVVQADMLDGAAIHSVFVDSAATVAIVAAGLGRDATHTTERGLAWRVNALGPSVVQAAAVGTGIRRVVFISSHAVYGNPGGETPLPESTAARPMSPYGHMKAEAERLLTESCPVAMQLVILRPCGLYGPAVPGREGSQAARLITSALTRVVTTGGLRIQGSVGPIDECLYVKDAAEATVLAALDSSSAPRRVFNVGAGRALTGAALCAALQEVFPTAQITFDSVRSDTVTARPPLDDSAIVRGLGFTPRYGLADGLADLAGELHGIPHAS